MAYANSRAIRFSFLDEVDLGPVNEWEVDLPLSSGKDFYAPLLVAGGGLIIAPNVDNQSFCAYGVLDGRPKWNFPVGNKLTLAASPVIHRLHFYFLCKDTIYKVSLIDGKMEENPIKIDSDENGIAPPTFIEDGDDLVLLFPLKRSIIIYWPNLDEKRHIEFKMNSNDFITTPVYSGERFYVTSFKGRFFEFDKNGYSPRTIISSGEDSKYRFSTAIVVEDRILFQRVKIDDSDRKLIQYIPKTDDQQAFSIGKMRVKGEDSYRRNLLYPPLSDGKLVVLSDLPGRTLYIYRNGSVRSLSLREKKNAEVIQTYFGAFGKNKMYCVSQFGLGVMDIETESLNTIKLEKYMRSAPLPYPIGIPIIYANRIIIPCQNKIYCRHLPR